MYIVLEGGDAGGGDGHVHVVCEIHICADEIDMSLFLHHTLRAYV